MHVNNSKLNKNVLYFKIWAKIHLHRENICLLYSWCTNIDFQIRFYGILLENFVKFQFSEPDFYGDLVYKLKKIVGSNNFSAQFIKIISHYKKIGYNINVLQQTACLVVNLITVGNFAFLFNCTMVPT